MALTLTAATSCSLKYLAEGNGQAKGNFVSKVDLIAATAPGALRQYLQRTFTDNEWIALPEGPHLALLVTQKSRATSEPVYAVFALDSTEQSMWVGLESQNTSAVIEIRYRHSLTE